MKVKMKQLAVLTDMALQKRADLVNAELSSTRADPDDYTLALDRYAEIALVGASMYANEVAKVTIADGDGNMVSLAELNALQELIKQDMRRCVKVKSPQEMRLFESSTLDREDSEEYGRLKVLSGEVAELIIRLGETIVDIGFHLTSEEVSDLFE